MPWIDGSTDVDMDVDLDADGDGDGDNSRIDFFIAQWVRFRYIFLEKCLKISIYLCISVILGQCKSKYET